MQIYGVYSCELSTNEIAKRVRIKYSLPKQISMHNHLEGFGGIIQTTLSIITGVTSENDMRLMIIVKCNQKERYELHYVIAKIGRAHV